MSAWSSRNRASASSCRAATSSRVRARLFSASALASARISSASAVALAMSWPASAFARSASVLALTTISAASAFARPVVSSGFLPRARRDLLRGLPRSLEDAAGLLPDLFERVPDSRPWRAGHLELRYHAIDSYDIGIDGRALVAADRARERNVADFFQRQGLALPLTRLGRIVIDQCFEYDQSRR
jgi:hypothetical protein